MATYDDVAREWAKRMRSGDNLAHEYLEKPAMYGKLPNLTGKTVLCLGCGSGEECEHLDSLNPEQVVGVDISKGLIEVAEESYPNLEFHVMDMEELSFDNNTFDFVFSSLVMHYKEEWQKTLNEVHRVLKPGGSFLFSTHHPVTWSAEILREGESKSKLLGYKLNESLKIYGDYLNRRNIKDVWFNELEVSFYHKPLEEILREIRESGFQILDFLEPKSVKEAEKVDKDFYDRFQRLPMFMIFELSKKDEDRN